MDLNQEYGLDSTAFNVGTGISTSLNDLANFLEDIADNHTGRTYLDERYGEIRNNTLDISRFTDLGWEPRHTLRDGLVETLDFIANQRNGS